MPHCLTLSQSLVGSSTLNADKLALDLQFASDRSFSKPSTLAAAETQVTSRRGPSPVFSRGSAATMIGSDGLIQYAPENLLLQSEAFNTTWVATGVNTTGTPAYVNVIAAPNGTTTADKFIPSLGLASHRFSQDLSVAAGSTYNYSCYFKAGEYNYGVLWINGIGLFSAADNYITFNILTGSVQNSQGGFTNVVISDVGNGWYRCSASLLATASGTASIRILGNSNGAVSALFSGDGTSGIYIWGAQLERSSSVRQYIPTTTSAVYGPRFDYDPSTLICKGLLLEESRTNLVFPSDVLTTQTRTVTAVAHTLSFYGTGTVVLSGVTGPTTVTGTGAYPTRTTLTFTPTAGSLVLTVTGSVVYAQLEVGSFATSYIPAITGSLARSSDLMTIIGSSFTSFYNNSAGTVSLKITGMDSTGSYMFGFIQTSAQFSNRWYSQVYNRAINTENGIISAGSGPTQFGGVTGKSIKLAFAIELNNGSLARDGSIEKTYTSFAMPLLIDKLIFDPTNGCMSNFRYYKKRLANAKLQALTA